MEGNVKKPAPRKLLYSAAILIALIVAFVAIYIFFMPKGDQFNKTIQVEVVYLDKTSDDFKIETSEEYLRGALEQINLIEGTDGDPGFFITTVNKVKAEDSKKEWWCITKGGEMVNTGADTTPIADGDHFELTLSTY